MILKTNLNQAPLVSELTLISATVGVSDIQAVVRPGRASLLLGDLTRRTALPWADL